MSQQTDSFSLSASSLATFRSTLVPQPVARNSNAPDSDSLLLRPCYYLERPDGTRTALIEVDQLPELFRIRDLPPKLSAADTAGMTSVGIKEGGHRKYIVEIVDSSANSHLEEPSKQADPENTSATITTTPSSIAPENSMIESNAQDSATVAQASSSTSTRPEQEIVTDRQIAKKGEKVYCTYWIARGECHYAQQGCRFKHEMPDLETLKIIMGRESFPKWWLESIGAIFANNRQQGKRRAISAKPLALPAPTTTHANSISASTTPSIVVQAPTEVLSNMAKSSPSTPGKKSVSRRDGGVDIRLLVSGASGSNTRTPVSRPSGSNTRSSISGSSGSNVLRVPSSGRAGSSVRAPIPGSIGNNFLSPNSGTSSNTIIHNKQPVNGIHSPNSGPATGSNSNIRSTSPGENNNTRAQTTKQPINNLTASPPTTSPASLRVKIPQKYTPPFRLAVLPTVSSSPPSSSATPMNKPRVNIPLSLLQNDVSPALGNGNVGKDVNSSALGNAKAKGKGENKGAEMEGRLNAAVIASSTTMSGEGGNQTTRPYDEVFDLLGPF